MNVVLWIIQIVLAFIFVSAGFMKVFTYEKAKEKIAWIKDAPKGLVLFIGIIELLGGLGLILPHATGIAPILTPVAAFALAFMMIPAAVLHVSRGENRMVIVNVIILLLGLF